MLGKIIIKGVSSASGFFGGVAIVVMSEVFDMQGRGSVFGLQ